MYLSTLARAVGRRWVRNEKDKSGTRPACREGQARTIEDRTFVVRVGLQRSGSLRAQAMLRLGTHEQLTPFNAVARFASRAGRIGLALPLPLCGLSRRPRDSVAQPRRQGSCFGAGQNAGLRDRQSSNQRRQHSTLW